MICKKCFRWLSSVVSYCNSCGTKLRPSRLDRILNDLNNPEKKARNSLLRLVDIPSWDFFVNQAFDCLKNNQQYEALEFYTKAISLNPAETKIYHDRGHTHFVLGKYKQANEDFDRALELDQNNLIARINRGVLLNKLGLFNQAIVDFDYALGLDATNSVCYSNRAVSYFEIGLYLKAKIDILRALEIKNDDPLNLFLAGEIYYFLGEKLVSKSFYEKAGSLGFPIPSKRLNELNIK